MDKIKIELTVAQVQAIIGWLKKLDPTGILLGDLILVLISQLQTALTIKPKDKKNEGKK